MNKPTLYLMFGYPGAGKTTAAEFVSELTGALHVSSDEVRLALFRQPGFDQPEHDELYATLDNLTEVMLNKGVSVIYDANVNRLQHRQDKYAICKRAGALCKLLWIQTPKDIAKDRAVHENRSHLWPKDETPAQMFERIATVVEEPGPDEPYIAMDGTQLTSEYVKQKLGL